MSATCKCGGIEVHLGRSEQHYADVYECGGCSARRISITRNDEFVLKYGLAPVFRERSEGSLA